MLIKFDASRISSRFAEYVFQFLRCADKTSCTFGMEHAETLIRNYISQMQLEVRSQLFIPDAKRGSKRGQAAVFKPEVRGAGALRACSIR